MDKWYAWIEGTRLYGAFLRHCVWAIAPFGWTGLARQVVVLRILTVALLWCLLPELALMVPAWLSVSAFGVAGSEAMLLAGAAALVFAMLCAPIVPRAGLMPLAWVPAMGALAFGNAAPAARIRDEAEQNFARWTTRHG
jgi:hypothetical protein